MHTEKDWQRAICECPSDDHLRLVYADWLDEQGRHDRAAYIRDDVQNPPNIYHNYHSEYPTFHPEFLLPELALLREQGWKRMTYNRGFLYSIDLPSDAFLAHYQTLFEHPIQEVRLTDCYPSSRDNWEAGDNYVWQRRSVTQEHWPDNWRERRYGVPDEIWEYLPDVGNNWVAPDAIRHRVNTFPPDVETGLRWLSDACVEWAREKVGLPALSTAN